MTASPFDLDGTARAILMEPSCFPCDAPASAVVRPRLSPESRRVITAFLEQGRPVPADLELAFHLLDRGAWLGAREILEMILSRTRDRSLRACIQYGIAAARLMGGPPAPALRACAAGLRLLIRGSDPMAAARIRALAIRAYRRDGDLDRSRRCLNRLREAGPRVGCPDLAYLIRSWEAEILRDERRLDAAISAYRDVVEMLAASGAPADRDPRPCAALRGWGEVLLELGRPDEAREKCAQAVSAAALLGGPSLAEHGRIFHLAARLALEGDDEDRIFHLLDRAEEEMRCANAEEDLALLLLSRAETTLLRLADGPKRERSARDLYEARGILWRLGRQRDCDRCELLLDASRRSNGLGESNGTPACRRMPRVPRSRRLTHLGFLTCDPGTLASLEPLESLGKTSIPILILGETGTGKEVLARALHRAAGSRGPFVPVNCGALPADLQESELFGHVRGAFTGAIADKIGLFEAANGGTLLLDEVGEMSPRAQVKLLRILELGEVRRVGETKTRKIHVRVVAATNVNLMEGIRTGAFRLDLYYRLCGLSVQLPPLRDRMADVPLLAAHFARLFWDRENPAPLPSPPALDRLLRHEWPGNVRELRFTMERAVAWTSALERDRIDPDVIEFEAVVHRPQESIEADGDELEEGGIEHAGGLDAYLTRTERRLILQALERNGWNRARAARSLGGMSRTTLIGKMKRLGLFPNRTGAGSADGPEDGPEDGSNPLGL